MGTLRALRIELVWLLLTTCSIAGMAWLEDYLWIFAVVPMFICVLAGLILLATRISQARLPELRRASLRRAGVVCGSLVALILCFPALEGAGASLRTELRFRSQRADFDRAVSLELSGHADERLQKRLRYVRDDGPPVRLAFPAPGGIIDNWCGTVFDETGSVMRINPSPEDALTYYEPPRMGLRKLFGGDMTGCRELHPPYYFCCFT